MGFKIIFLSEVMKKTGAEYVAYGTMGLNLGRGKNNINKNTLWGNSTVVCQIVLITGEILQN